MPYQVENSKKEIIVHGVYGRMQRLSCRESWGSEAGRFLIQLEAGAFFQSRPEVISISYRDLSVPGCPSEIVFRSCGLL